MACWLGSRAEPPRRRATVVPRESCWFPSVLNGASRLARVSLAVQLPGSEVLIGGDREAVSVGALHVQSAVVIAAGLRANAAREVQQHDGSFVGRILRHDTLSIGTILLVPYRPHSSWPTATSRRREPSRRCARAGRQCPRLRCCHGPRRSGWQPRCRRSPRRVGAVAGSVRRRRWPARGGLR
ncbi:MAG: hypothetical protein QOF67_2089 [Mycobacterium sp.]|nr:hypothetical protein [Mycobacterium sp.]